MKQLEFFDYNLRKEISNCQKRINRAEKRIEWLACLYEMREQVMKQKTIELPKERQMEMFG